MTDDQIIDKILSELQRVDPGGLYVASFVVDKLGLPALRYSEFVDFLDAEGLANPHDPRHRMSITAYGRQICKAGGWLAHVDRLNAKRQEDDKHKAIEISKLKDDAILSRWQVRTFWWVFIFGIWGGISGTISLALILKDRYSQQPAQKQTEQTIDTISISHQPKTDSLTTKKTH